MYWLGGLVSSVMAMVVFVIALTFLLWVVFATPFGLVLIIGIALCLAMYWASSSRRRN